MKHLLLLPLFLSAAASATTTNTATAFAGELTARDNYECTLGRGGRGTVTLSYSRLGIWVAGKDIRFGKHSLPNFSREMLAESLPEAVNGKVLEAKGIGYFLSDEKFREQFGQYGLLFSESIAAGSANFRLNATADGQNGVLLPASRDQKVSGYVEFQPENWREEEAVGAELRCRQAKKSEEKDPEFRSFLTRVGTEIADNRAERQRLLALFKAGEGFSGEAALPGAAGVYAARCLYDISGSWRTVARKFGTALQPVTDYSFAFVNIAGEGPRYAAITYPGFRGQALVNLIVREMKPFAPPYIASRLENGNLVSDHRDFEKAGAPYYMTVTTRPVGERLVTALRDTSNGEVLCLSESVEVPAADLPEELR